ncbi:MAG: murein L,D-transpeptidase [Deltaproteobacteria bacterium]|nr:murein L,D-transpeptidase [Deltaproteobacteria bacterium]
MRMIIVVTALQVCTGFQNVSEASAIPSSDRSREAVGRTKMRIENQLAAKGLRWGDGLFLRVFKDEAVIEAWMMKQGGQYELYKSFPICRFSGGLGPKLKTGDGKTPEGFYGLRSGSFNPYSAYHLSLNIGFPNKYDRHHGRTGRFLMIHGDCVSIGCLAMTDNGIEEIYALVEAAVAAGQFEVPLHIFPFRLDRFTLFRYLRFDSFGFWRELRDGYRYFEDHRRPPQIDVRDGRYVILD